MPIVVRLDRVMADRKINLSNLSEKTGISTTNLSRMKMGHIRATRFNTLERLCFVLDCQPGDLMEYVYSEDDEFNDGPEDEG